ncbi:MAG: glycosyltransferase involved in cell wall biosynthesis [Gammaproteobacteria bacterium]
MTNNSTPSHNDSVKIRSSAMTTTPLPGINFYSPVGINSGLGAAGRGYVSAFRAAGLAHQIIPVHELHTHQPAIPFEFPTGPARYPIAVVHVNAYAGQQFLHFHKRSFERAKYRIGFWVWELASVRKSWIPAFDLFDEIWVPSEFCRRAFAAHTEKPVTVIPHVVEVKPERRSTEESRARLGWDHSDVTFLYVFDASSSLQRKNPDALLAAFLTEFQHEPSVRLVIKVTNLNVEKAFKTRLCALAAKHRNVEIISKNITIEELDDLYNAANCYVSPHRSEGFGLTIAESMACGKPVIATNYGGSTNFVNPSVAYPLDFSLVEIQENHGPYTKGFVWAEPSVQHLCKLLRTIVEHPDEAKKIGEAAKRYIAEQLSPLAVGTMVRKRVSEIASEL